MADRDNEEYKSLKFYADNTKPKKSGFSKFQVGDRFYFCRYVDGDIAVSYTHLTLPTNREV